MMKTWLVLWWVGGALALPHPSRPLAPHNAWNPFFGEGFQSINVQFMDNLRGELMRDFNSRLDHISSAFDRNVERLSDKMADISVQFDEIDVGSHLDHVGDLVTDYTSELDLGSHLDNVGEMMTGYTAGLGLPDLGDDMLRLFGRQPWWKGDNICVHREVEEDGALPRGVNISYSGQGQVHMQLSQCREESDLYECTKSVMDNGEVKTTRITYSCCPGFKRQSTGPFSTRGCQEYEIKPIEETIAGLEGTDFLSLISEHNLIAELVNSTVFVPDNRAMDDYYTELKGLQAGSMDSKLVYNIDDGLKARKRRELNLQITEQPDMREILLGHITPAIIHSKDLTDKNVLPSKNPRSPGLRVHVYNTLPERTVLVNCARITSKDHHTTGGMVHMVDKVVQPSTLSIAEILASDSQFSAFRSALDSKDLEQLSAQDAEFTVFVPTDAAFKKLDPATRKSLLGSGSTCGSHILRSHILSASLCSGLLVPGTRLPLTNLQGEALHLAKLEDGRLRVEDIDIVVKDIVATNGVLHVIDSLIVPPSGRPLAAELKKRTRGLLNRLGVEGTAASERLVARLSGLRNVSLFLPAEAAIGRLSAHLLKELKDDEKRLEELILHHILPGNRNYDGFRHNEELSTLAGKRVHAKLHSDSGLASLGCARVVHQGDKVCDGNIFTIDRLLLPPQGDLTQILAQEESSHKEFSKLVKAAGLSELVESAHTIFAPVDEAFQKLSEALKKRIFGEPALAEKVVRHHIVPNIVCCHSTPRLFYMYRSEPNIGGDHLQLRKTYNGRLLVNGAGVLRCDVAAENGILHSIDSVLLPPELQEPRRGWGLLRV